MAPEYLLIVFGLVPSLLALATLFYALARRQGRASDQEMFTALEDEEPDYTAGPVTRRIPAFQAGGFLLALLAVCGVIGWTIFETVRVSQRVAQKAALPAPARAASDGGE